MDYLTATIWAVSTWKCTISLSARLVRRKEIGWWSKNPTMKLPLVSPLCVIIERTIMIKRWPFTSVYSSFKMWSACLINLSFFWFLTISSLTYFVVFSGKIFWIYRLSVHCKTVNVFWQTKLPFFTFVKKKLFSKCLRENKPICCTTAHLKKFWHVETSSE